MIKVAVVEDDTDLLEELHFNLSDEGLCVTRCPDGAALTQVLPTHGLDAVVLDLGLPGEGGDSIVRRLRREWPRLGIVILSARSQSQDRVRLMEEGADVYMTKPVDMRELALVIKALVRRLRPNKAQEHVLVLLADRHQLVSAQGTAVDLTLSETTLLARLARATGQALSRRQIIEALGGDYLQYDERRLEALISRLRKKLETAGVPSNALTAVRGQGYALQVTLHERINSD